MKNTKTFIGLYLLTLGLIALSPHEAKADSSLHEIQITCSKELRYFSLHTLNMENRNDVLDDEHEKQLETQNGLFRPSRLVDHPYTCDIGNGVISAEIAHYRPERAQGECGGQERFDVVIKKNGSAIYDFNPYGLHCTNPETHVIEVLYPYSIRDCTLPSASGQASCKYSSK